MENAIANSQMYQMIHSVDELKWFFDHVIQKPQVNESYSMVFVSRHKKLTKEEQKTIGLTRAESEFLATQAMKLRSIRDSSETNGEFRWTFEEFLKHVRRFNVDKYAYTTALGEPIPEKTLAVLFYVNPADDMVVADNMIDQLLAVKTGIAKAMLNGKSLIDNIQSYQAFGNIESNVKHLKAQCKGASYWIDYDIDVPKWFKEGRMKGKGISKKTYYRFMCEDIFEPAFGKGNYVVVDTSGGYHVLVRSSAIKSNPHSVCETIKDLYDTGVIDYGEQPYVDEDGQLKFECTINGSHQKYNPDAEREVKEAVAHLELLQASDAITQREFKVLRRSLYESLKAKDNKSSIPGIPLPGTFQYGRPVTVLNKADFVEAGRNE